MRTWILVMLACLLLWMGGVESVPHAAAEKDFISLDTKEQAIARAMELMLIPNDAQITEATRVGSSSGLWRLGFLTAEKNENGNATHGGEIVLRSSDGELLSYSQWKWPTDSTGWGPAQEAFDMSKEKVDREEAIKIARSFLDGQPWKLNAEWIVDPYPESEYSTRTDSKTMHKIRFDRANKGMRLDQQTFSVFVDRISGEVVAYEVNWHKTEFVSPSHMLDQAAAARILVDLAQPYLTNAEGGNDLLGYAMVFEYTLDAVKGTLPERYNIPIPNDKVVGKPKISNAMAKQLLLSMYEIELQYAITDTSMEGWRVEPFYRMVVKPEVPRFYTGKAPIVDARSGQWKDFVGAPLQRAMPEPSDWLIAAAASTGRIRYPSAIAVEGEFVALTAAPIVQNGKVLTSAKELMTAIRGNLLWDAKTSKLTAIKDGKRLVMKAGSDKALLNGKTIRLQSAVRIVKGRTHMPATAIQQAFGANVSWQASSRFLLIRMNDRPVTPTASELGKLRWDAQLEWARNGFR